MLGASAHVILLLFAPLFLLGIINRTKAFFAGRKGPPILQPYYDVIKLARKDLVLSRTATWIFVAGPVVGLATVLLGGLLVPLGPIDSPLHFTGDLILFMYLLGLGRFFTTAAALDTGSSFEGMGAAREVTFACLIEPTMFFSLLALARLSGALSLTPMLQAPWGGAWAIGAAPLVMVTAGIFIVLLAENSRIPFDDPNTHLELTMIHEVMVLDHSGPLFGMILYAAALKLFIFGLVLASIVAPINTGSIALDTVAMLGALIVISVLIGVTESLMARLRLKRILNLLAAACLLSAFGFLLLVR